MITSTTNIYSVESISYLDRELLSGSETFWTKEITIRTTDGARLLLTLFVDKPERLEMTCAGTFKKEAA